MAAKKAKGAMTQKQKPARAKKTTAKVVRMTPVSESCGHLTLSTSGMVAGRIAPDAEGNAIPSFRFAKIGA